MILNTSDFDYDLPPQYIAQTPAEPRDAARLLVLDRASGELSNRRFSQISEYLRPGDVLVLNRTRVIPARVYAHKLPGGGKVELLLLRQVDELTWEALGGGKGLTTGRMVQLEDGPQAEIIAELNGAERRVRFSEPLTDYLQRAGHMPLPPYIHAPLSDPERYQTVYASQAGSAAAPTAGLHFTPKLLEQVRAGGVQTAYVTLHIGLDTFAPVTEDQPAEHKIHTEWCELTPQTAGVINRAARRGGRIVAVGTTSVRTLETAAAQAKSGQRVGAFSGATSIYILPGYQFRAVDALITNFHLPRSTLIMLVSAFAGRERILETYERAKRMGYRFYSFGDAMLIV